VAIAAAAEVCGFGRSRGDGRGWWRWGGVGMEDVLASAAAALPAFVLFVLLGSLAVASI